MEKRNFDFAFLQKIVEIDTSNRSNIPKAIDLLINTFSYASEYEIIDDTALVIGVNCKLHNISSGIVFSGHIDTVSGLNCIDYSCCNEKIFGRGTSDMKSFFACLNYVLRCGYKSIKYPLIIAITFDEETNNKGILSIIRFFNKRFIHPDYCIVGEPTSNKCCFKNMGCYDAVVKLHSNVGHIVNEKKSDVVRNGVRLLGYITNYVSPPMSELYLSYVNYGNLFNQTGQNFEIGLEFRCQNVSDSNRVFSDINNYISNMSCEGQICRLDNYLIPFNNSSKRLLNKIMSLSIPCDGTFIASSEAGFFQNENIETVIFGPGDLAQAHTANEYIPVSNMECYSCLLGTIIQNLC